MIGNLNVKTKVFDFEERVLIGWLANTVRERERERERQRERERVIQDAYLKVQHFCFYVNKVVYHF